MSQTASDFIVQRLRQWGVRHMFGYPGDGINGVFGSLNRADGKIGFVQARHEEMEGPGASHLIAGLYDALLEQRIINGDPKFEASQRIPDVSYSRFAEMIGLTGIFVDNPQLVGSAWEQALARHGRCSKPSCPERSEP